MSKSPVEIIPPSCFRKCRNKRYLFWHFVSCGSFSYTYLSLVSDARTPKISTLLLRGGVRVAVSMSFEEFVQDVEANRTENLEPLLEEHPEYLGTKTGEVHAQMSYSLYVARRRPLYFILLRN